MMREIVFSLAILLMPIFAEAAVPAWHIVPSESSLIFTATQNNSPVSGEFKKFTGEVKFDPAQLNTSSAHIVVDINSVTTSYSEVGDTLKTSDWFDVKLYPQAVLEVTQFSKTGSNQYQAQGMLTIRDKTVPVTLTFTLDEYSQTKAHAKGTTILKRTAFGLGKGDWAKTDEVKDDVRVDFVVAVERPDVTSTGIHSVISANNQFALDLYSQLKKTDGNIFFSPYSISTALAMTYEGARGKTAEEIQAVFHFPTDSNLRQSSFAAIHNQINNPNSKYTLSIANALWAQNDYKFLNSYINILQQYYAGTAFNVDFKNSSAQARQTINKWVEDKTNNKIKDLFPPGSLDNTTRLVLVDAVYFKGTWAKPFQKQQTREDNFRINAINTVKVPMMQQTDEDAKFNYTETDNLQILEMPYEGNKLSMLILLPKNNNLSALESALSLEAINDWKSKLREQHVDVFMPKFTFDAKYFLNGTLAKMGMPTAFTNAADFFGMDGTKNLSIQDVIHQAFVDVNEEGTEAAAATGVSMILASAILHPIFRADHPFIFIIQDKDNGNILFLGRVSNPSK